jgi:hypothetical protein
MDITYIRTTVRFSLSEKLLSYDILFRHDGSGDAVGGRKSERKSEAARSDQIKSMAHGGLMALNICLLDPRGGRVEGSPKLA